MSCHVQFMYSHANALACVRKDWRKKTLAVSHDFFLSDPLKLLRVKVTLLRPCNIYRKCSLNCAVRAFANHGKCWPNGLQHIMINYGCSPSLRACGYAEKADIYFATLPSFLPLLVLTFVHFSDSSNYLQLSVGVKKRLLIVFVSK